IVLTDDVPATEINSFFIGDSTSNTASKFAAFQFTNMGSIASTFDAGTIIVIVGDTAAASEDTSYNPGGGDWNIILGTSGAFLTEVNTPGNTMDFAATDVAWIDDASSGSTIASSDGFGVNWDSSPGTFGGNASVTAPQPSNNTGLVLTSDLAGATIGSNWTDDVLLGDMTPGEPNGGDNTDYINGLRGGGSSADCAIIEVRINDSGEDDEFVEIIGDPSTDITDLTFIVISGNGSFAGLVDVVIDFSGETTDANGFVLAADSAAGLLPDISIPGLDFFSGTQSVLLVEGFTGNQGDDLDTNNDGTLETTPWTNVVDSVGLTDGDVGEPIYIATTIIGPDSTFAPAHFYRCPDATGSYVEGSFSDLSSDTPDAVNDCGGSGVIGACGDPATFIHAVQGNGASTPIPGATVEVEGVVVGDFQGASGLDGFFLQEEDSDRDGSILTSEGIFIYDPGSTIPVDEGDVVRVLGDVSEFFDQTQITLDEIADCQATDIVTPTTITFPLPNGQGDLEAVEGMLVEFTQQLVVSDMFNLGEFGEITLSTPDVLTIPTETNDPGAPANAAELANEKRQILVDDGSGDRYLDPVPYVNNFSPETLRRGDSTDGNVLGVMGYGFDNYRVQPLSIGFTRDIPRPAVPSVDGDITVVSFNVLNYFNTIDDGANSARGADSPAELARQEAKLVDAMCDLNADIFALQELENNGDAGMNSAIAELTDALNADADCTGTYAYVDTGTTGDNPGGVEGPDAITVGFIYKTSTVSTTGTTAILETGPFDVRSRPPVAQAFTEASSGETFIVVNNHYKSKGCSGASGGDEDQGDGQSCYNATRVQSSQDILTWLAGDPTATGTDQILITGDLNSYTQEDPITVLESNGFTNLLTQFITDVSDRYTFVFFGQQGVLDHALATSSLLNDVTDVAIWHINADEPRALNYDDNILDTSTSPFDDELNNDISLYQADQWRSSDHDPVIVGLDFPGSANLLVNGSFEDDFTGNWNNLSDDGPFTTGFAFDGTRVMLFNADGSQELIRQTVSGVSGSSGDTVELVFYVGGQNLVSGGQAGARIETFNGGSPADLVNCLVSDRGTFNFTQVTCTLNATSNFDEIRVSIGLRNIPSGFFGIDAASLTILP
ncbi:MAG: ExeM/NucH family extracellular endonuclease, partial [Anaerolineae bacterium]